MKHNTYNMLYTHDGNKNVSEVMFANPINGIGAHYEYAPFGAITRATRDTPDTEKDIINQNPFRFSSEFYDPELGLVYYNYRHYSPTDGRWLSRDPIEEQGGYNLYAFVKNSIHSFDKEGLLEHFTFELNNKECSYLIHQVINEKGVIRRRLWPAFSGNGNNRNNPKCCSIKDEGPLPKGEYFIVDRPTGRIKNWRKDEWFALYRNDGVIDDETIEEGIIRNQIRLHPGTISYGCITLQKETFKVLRNFLLQTKKEKIYGTDIEYYGTITVK